MATMYNPLEDRFVVFNTVETPKVELKMPLFDEPLDMRPMGVSKVTEKGNMVMKNNLQDKMIHDNPTPTYSEQPTVDANYTVNESVKGNSKQAMDFFYKKLLEKNKGKQNAESLSYIQAAGMVGNLIQESGLNTGIRGDGGKALGIAQWHPDRQEGLKKLAKSKGTKITDFNTQLEYVWHELNNSEKKAFNALLNSKTINQATEAFMKFERPGDPQFEKRLNYAKSLLSS